MAKYTIRSLLEEWIERRGGYLHQKFSLLQNKKFDDPTDASALCAALRHPRADELDAEADRLLWFHCDPAWYVIARMLCRAETKKTWDVIRAEGLPLLRHRITDALSDAAVWDEFEGKLGPEARHLKGRPEHYAFLLAILANYRDAQDASLVQQVARNQRFAHALGWRQVFNEFLGDHPRQLAILDALRNPLPRGLVGLAYLDFANAVLRGGLKTSHPFDTAPGLAELLTLLNDADSQPVSAIAAAPYISLPGRSELLEVASKHKDIHVRMEAAWARARLGNADAIEHLKEWMKDPRHYDVAKAYLEELEASPRDNSAATDPDFSAAIEMSSWLSHENEFGRPPDFLQLRDTRTLHWPPTKDKRQLWLFEFGYERRNGEERRLREVGLVGSTTFAYSDASPELAVEDLYALYCVREQHWLPETDRTIAYGREQLRKHNKGF